MRNSYAATKNRLPFGTMLMLLPMIAGLTNPSMVTSAMSGMQGNARTAITGFAGDLSSSLGGGHSGGALFVSGGPIYLPHS